jgi:amino acid transporter
MSTENQQNAAAGSPDATAKRSGASVETASSAGPCTPSLGEPLVAGVDATETNHSPDEQVVHVTASDESGVVESGAMPDEGPSIPDKLKTLLIGKPRDLADKSVFTHISLVAFLAWVGLGADGLSSSCYGPPEAFWALQGHTYLGVFLALAIMGTVWIIATCYSHIIEEFPTGGGGYLVASKLLGRPVGVISGCALLVDYVMTITVSIAAAGDALMGPDPSNAKFYGEIAAILVLILLNLRGVKESVQFLLPIFLVFLVTHFAIIVGSIGLHLTAVPEVVVGVAKQVQTDLGPQGIGLLAMLSLLLRAYSLGAGTYTGLEAVSNSMQVMREPRVATGRKTMVYMAVSLAFTAGGLIVAYFMLDIFSFRQELRESGLANMTLNRALTLKFVGDVGLGTGILGNGFLWTTLLSEGLLLFVGAQAGFIDGPRLLSNMAHDSWMPRWFGNLSERLAVHNGVLLMGSAALAAMFLSRGEVSFLIILYSINVFITFSLSMIGMARHWYQMRGQSPLWRRRLALFVCGAVMCVAILCVTVYEKLWEGGWITLVVTGLCVAFAYGIHWYYRKVGSRLKVLDAALQEIPTSGPPNLNPPDPLRPTAIVLVGGYSGLGVHTLLNIARFAPDYYKNFIFVSAGVVDTGNFKGSGAVEDLQKHTQESLDKYVDLARRLGLASEAFMAIGTDAVDELEELCRHAAKKYPKSTVFAGQLVFQRDSWLQRFLHNQTAYSLQRRLQWMGLPMVILPTRVR